MRYLVFAGMTPAVGGANDLVGSFHEPSIEFVKMRCSFYDWWHIYDTQEFSFVASKESCHEL